MTQSIDLIDALKRELRTHRISYSVVAKHLDLSEASVKRMLAGGHLTLQRLEKICALVHWDLSDLNRAALDQQSRLDHLTPEQEQEIASDLLLLLVAVSVINGFSYEDLLQHYCLSDTDCIRKLARLDALKLIDLLPGNRIKLRISPNFRWRADGPIQRFFLDKVVDEFFNSRFDQSSEKLLVINGLLSDASNIEMQKKMDRWLSEFNETARQDAGMDMKDKSGTTLVVALRRWRFPLFDKLLRK